MNEDAIIIEGFTKQYMNSLDKTVKTAVDDLTLSVKKGSLFGFLGPNGAGKTTTIKMLLGFISATKGNAWLFKDPVCDDSARKSVGYLPEHPYFHKFLTAQEVVNIHAELAGLYGSRKRDAVENAMKITGMIDYRKLQLTKCSKGMVQRVGLASALVGKPDLLILDEPSSGLDPIARRDLRNLLSDLHLQGITIFLSSHLLSEMEYLCDTVAIMCKGHLVAQGTPDQIIKTREEVAVQIEQKERDNILAEQVELLGCKYQTNDNGLATVITPSTLVYNVIKVLEKHKATLLSVTQNRETLEDAFLRLVG